ncbi:MAG: BREX system ATP-binding domain-containing protein [Bacteroidia bacterium]
MAFIKDSSPFYSGRPLPHDLFTGRDEQITLIERSLRQVAAGKQQAVFLTGEFGIGKSSLAHATRYIAETKYNLTGIHVFLGGAKTIDDLSERTLESAIITEAYRPKATERIREMLSKYIGKQSLFGVNINFDALKKDAPNLSRGFLPFLKELYKRSQPDGVKGICLILDEINGITKNPDFAHFIKTFVDSNALSKDPLPVLLLLCGVKERREEMIAHHRPTDRIFDIVDLQTMKREEANQFFIKTFAKVGCNVSQKALDLMYDYSQGHPKAMNIIGDNVFWKTPSTNIDVTAAISGIYAAAEEIGHKFIDSQVLNTIESKDYQNILRKISSSIHTESLVINKKNIIPLLTVSENAKLNNFLLKLKKQNVIRPGFEPGEYIFNDRLARLYLTIKFSR